MYVICTQKNTLTSNIVLFRFEAVAGEHLPSFTAGSHIEVQITPKITRAYSLCSPPSLSSVYYEIAVKREKDSKGGSIAMHDTIEVGTVLTVSTPQNYFPLIENASHHVLVAGGIGLTPIIAMAHKLSEINAPFTLVISASSEDELPFLDQLNTSNWSVYKHLSGRQHFDLSTLLHELPDDLHLYCCGPHGFIDTVREQCQALSEGHFHKEYFSAVASNDHAAVELYLSESHVRVSVVEGTSMISALRQAGIEVESVCEQGICGSCVVPWRDGDPIHNDQCLESNEQEKYIALCCAGCRSPNLTLEL